MAAVVSIVGKKGSGKAEILTEIISILSKKGYRIGVIKHLMKTGLEIDEPGTDTYQYRMNGAETVMLAGEKRFAVFQNLTEAIPLEELLYQFEGFHLVFLEGYSCVEVPKIEIHHRDTTDVNGLVSDIEERFLAQYAEIKR